jgi:hypothetical protein
MDGVSSNAYRLLGFAVWNGAKWYLRRRLPSRPKLLVSALAGFAGLSAAVVLVRRLSA